MVRQGPPVRTARAWFARGLAFLLLSSFASLPTQAQEPKKSAATPESSKSGKSESSSAPQPEKATAPGTPIELKPYSIRVFVTFELSSRVDRQLRDAVVNDWKKLAGRFVGAPWDIQTGDSDGPAGLLVLDDLTPAEAKKYATGVDKVWFIQGRAEREGLVLSGREFDVVTGSLGTQHEETCPVVADLPRSMLRLTLSLFAPVATIGQNRGGGVMIEVQGSALPNPNPIGAVVALGSVFAPVRVFLNPDGSPLEVMRVPYSYLRVASMDGTSIYCNIISGLRDPLTRRVIRKNKMIALGIKPAAAPTRLRFVYDGSKAPASGYLLTFKPIPVGPSRDVGMTDREGRVVLPSGFANSLVRLRLIGGKAEPMVDVPIMPGETLDERTIPFIPRPQTITFESQIDALRDAIIDVVAVRSRLEKRMKARVESDTPDWDDVADSLMEYYKQPTRDSFVKKLESLQTEARANEKKTKILILTRNALSQINDTKALIDRYLDDELFAAYADAMARSKSKSDKVQAALKAAPKPAPAETKSAAPVALAQPVEKPPAATTTRTSVSTTPAPAPAGKPAPAPKKSVSKPAPAPSGKGTATPF